MEMLIGSDLSHIQYITADDGVIFVPSRCSFDQYLHLTSDKQGNWTAMELPLLLYR